MRTCIRCKLPIEAKTYYERNHYDNPVHRECRVEINQPIRYPKLPVTLPPATPQK